MKIYILAALLPLLWIADLSAQYTEAGAFMGASNYIGDLQQQLVRSEYNPGFGLQIRRIASKRWAFQGHFYKLRITGDDQNQLNAFLRARNLSVRTDIYELGFQAEYNLFPYEIRTRKISAPYVFAGVAGSYFMPQASFMGSWRNLQPLGTEGQTLDGSDDKYSLLTPVIPFGVGFRINLSERINLQIEAGLRYTFTDYLDDISGLYPDIEKLTTQDPLAAALSYRSPEFAGEPLSNPVGTPRGDAYARDLVFVGGIGITFNLASGYDLELDPKYRAFRDFMAPAGFLNQHPETDSSATDGSNGEVATPDAATGQDASQLMEPTQQPDAATELNASASMDTKQPDGDELPAPIEEEATAPPVDAAPPVSEESQPEIPAQDVKASGDMPPAAADPPTASQNDKKPKKKKNKN